MKMQITFYIISIIIIILLFIIQNAENFYPIQTIFNYEYAVASLAIDKLIIDKEIYPQQVGFKQIVNIAKDIKHINYNIKPHKIELFVGSKGGVSQWQPSPIPTKQTLYVKHNNDSIRCDFNKVKIAVYKMKSNIFNWILSIFIISIIINIICFVLSFRK